MKKILCIFILGIISLKNFGQFDTTSIAPVKPTNDYSLLIQKSKIQKTTAWIMVIGGSITSAAGVILWAYKEDQNSREFEANNPGGGCTFCFGDSYVVKFNGWLILSGIGLSAAVLSPLVFRASQKNRKASAKLSTSFIIEKSSRIQGLTISKIHYPAFSVKLSL